MSTTPNEPSVLGSQATDYSPVPRWVPILFGVAFFLLAFLLYATLSGRKELRSGLDQANQENKMLATQLDKSNVMLSETRGQLEVTSQKLGLTQDELARAHALAESLHKKQKLSDAQIRAIQQENAQKLGQLSSDLSGTKSDVEATKKDLEETKAKLTSTIGDLGVQSGLIARNHEEVDALRRLNERNIFEFNLGKAKNPQHVGPIQLTLRKTDPKRYKYTVAVLADDKNIEKRDKTANEPVQFYVHGFHVPYEIVVYDVAKDKITGYLSTPKEPGVPAATPTSAPAPSSPSASSSPGN